MKVKETYKEDNFDFTGHLEIRINNKKTYSFSDGEPEDNTLHRNFNDCFSITDIMKEAYNAGKDGEPFEYEYVEETEEDNDH
jgi:hypothetical protein